MSAEARRRRSARNSNPYSRFNTSRPLAPRIPPPQAARTADPHACLGECEGETYGCHCIMACRCRCTGCHCDTQPAAAS